MKTDEACQIACAILHKIARDADVPTRRQLETIEELVLDMLDYTWKEGMDILAARLRQMADAIDAGQAEAPTPDEVIAAHRMEQDDLAEAARRWVD